MKTMFTAAAIVATLGLAPTAGGIGGDRDRVSGTGQFVGVGPLGPTDVMMHVNATSGPLGEDARGHLFVKRVLPSEVAFQGEVTCLLVVGNRATIGGRVVNSRLPFPEEGTGIVIQVVDNGEGNDPPDLMRGFFTPVPPVMCPPPPEVGLLTQQGNWVVHDAKP